MITDRNIFRSFLCIASILLTACHYGDAGDNLMKLSKSIRQLDYQVSIALPNASDDVIIAEDRVIDGLLFNWSDSASFALFGQQFADTAVNSSIPLHRTLSFVKSRENHCQTENRFSWFDFEFNSFARHGVGENYTSQVCFFYPERFATDLRGNSLSSHATTVPLDFTGQDGLLPTVQKNYFMAYGVARSFCEKRTVELTDTLHDMSNLFEGTRASQSVLLDSKVAILRLALVVPAQRDFTLLEYLHSRNMSGYSFCVDHIEIENQNENELGFSQVELNLHTGFMESLESSLSFLTINDKDHFWNHPQIMCDEPQSIGEGLESSGTLLYVAIPCVSSGELNLKARISVYIVDYSTLNAEPFKLYGEIENVTLKEGGYCITSPVRLSPDRYQIEPAKTVHIY